MGKETAEVSTFTLMKIMMDYATAYAVSIVRSESATAVYRKYDLDSAERNKAMVKELHDAIVLADEHISTTSEILANAVLTYRKTLEAYNGNIR